MGWKQITLTGWGRTRRATVAAWRAERESDIVAALEGPHERGIIACGGARSYGDPHLNDGGRVVLTRRLNRLLAFDDGEGVLAAEAGVTFRDLHEVLVPRGFMVPVSPGTGFATLGGAVANDVHGKNHDRIGGFGDHLLWLDLALPGGEVVRASPEERPALFAATVGGIGLTGVVLRIGLRLVPAPSAAVAVRAERMPDLDAFLAGLEAARPRAPFSVGWIDGLARGGALGRGILETADFAEAGAGPAPRRRALRVPMDFPSLALNRASVALFNQAYYRRIPRAGRERIVPLHDFLYPLDSLHDWNRVYGRPGFYQFQCVLPDGEAPAGLRRLLEAVADSGRASFLAVLKTLGGPGRGPLSFPIRGHTLALDLPRRPGVEDLLGRLEGLVLDHGGRLYLAKDAVMSAAGFRQMYPRLDEFREAIHGADPDGRLASDMARRLAIRDGRP